MDSGRRSKLSGSGREITLDEFKQMDERDQFAYVFVAVKAINHLEIASKTADTLLERGRSVFGAHNLKKNLEGARDIYDSGKG